MHSLRGVWLNAGECSFRRAVDVFRGTDVVLIPRWVLNKQSWFKSRVDYVRHILASKASDVSVFLEAHHFADQSLHDPGVAEEQDQNAVSEDILRVIEKYSREGVID